MSAVEQPPIADFALIGDCHGSALVSRSASIDWCCLRQFDADPIFFRMLDAGRGAPAIAPSASTGSAGMARCSIGSRAMCGNVASPR